HDGLAAHHHGGAGTGATLAGTAAHAHGHGSEAHSHGSHYGAELARLFGPPATAHAASSADESRGDAGPRAADPGHGAHSLAHRSLAVGPGGVALLASLEAPFEDLAFARFRPMPCAVTAGLPAQARGPPRS